ncbi:thioredoxin domain-containing protein 5 homolog [Drosophila ficusphila]|uniref:thioredoxin domain-containing protein 5 homolog n=1 Tax=Drosophila ficusphila TaxID=30025 RepID=UPI001C89D3CB|nr:thioredoxin domain-containing protein 5 homolog [Drosophila ficusphila]
MFAILSLLLCFPFLSIQNPHLQSDAVLNINPKFLNLYLDHEDVLAEFYFSPCNSCTKMSSLLDYLMVEIDLTSLLTIVSIDCRKYSKYCLQYQIKHYPEWVLFEKNGVFTHLNNSENLIQSLTKYNISKNNIPLARQMLNDTFKDSEIENVCEPGKVLKLNSKNFYPLIRNGTFFVKLYSPNCVSCAVLFTIWKELAAELANETKVCIAEYDCTTGMQICKDQQTTRVPALIWFENGQQREKYTGNKNRKDLKNYVSKMTLSKNSQSSVHQKRIVQFVILTQIFYLIERILIVFIPTNYSFN